MPTKRPAWADVNESTRTYFDTEWGKPPKDERDLFECLALIIFQVGLNWALVLSKRDALRKVLFNFDPRQLGTIETNRIASLTELSPIRNETKIRAIVTNAKVFVAINGDIPLNELLGSASLYTPTSLVEKLRSLGFVFIGPKNVVALCEMIGAQPPQNP